MAAAWKAGSMMELWEKSIKPTLYDYGGEVLICSNSAGKNPDNFFYNICTDPQYGFKQFHATTMDNPLLPKKLNNESRSAWFERREQIPCVSLILAIHHAELEHRQVKGREQLSKLAPS
jgi:hypothetical protein